MLIAASSKHKHTWVATSHQQQAVTVMWGNLRCPVQSVTVVCEFTVICNTALLSMGRTSVESLISLGRVSQEHPSASGCGTWMTHGSRSKPRKCQILQSASTRFESLNHNTSWELSPIEQPVQRGRTQEPYESSKYLWIPHLDLCEHRSRKNTSTSDDNKRGTDSDPSIFKAHKHATLFMQ